MTRRIVSVGLAAGFLLNVLGWLGNQLVLGRMWRDTVAAVVPLRQRSWVNEVLSLVPDFIYGVALAWLFVVLVRAGWSRRRAALEAAFWTWLVGAATTYLGIWNSGFVPGDLAVATTLLAFVLFIPGALLVDRMFGSAVTATAAR